MKTVFFHPSFGDLGGAELLAATQATYLKGQAWDVSLVTFGFREEVWRNKLMDIPVDVVPRRHWTDLFRGRLEKWKGRAHRAEPFLARAETVLAHNPPAAAMLGHMAIKGLRVWYCHEAPWRLHPESVDYDLLQCPGSSEALQALRRRILERAKRDRALAEWDWAGVARLDRIIANSGFCRDNLQRIYGRSDIQVIPPIVAFDEHSHRPGLDRGAPQILTLARLEALKNVGTVLRGFARFASDVPRARLHVVGDGHARPSLTRLARELGVEDRVHFHGYLDPCRDRAKLDEVFQTCDVFALLPIDESFGLVFAEAAARGLLLVGPDRGGPPEILEGGRLGWTLPCQEPEAFTQALHEIWHLTDEDAALRRRETERSCRARYSVETVGPRLEAALRPLMPHS